DLHNDHVFVWGDSVLTSRHCLNFLSFSIAASIAAGFLLCRFNVALQSFEVDGPEAPVLVQPLIDLAKRLDVQLAVTFASLLLIDDELRFTEDAEVLGDGRPADRKTAGERAHRLPSSAQPAQDGPPRRVGKGSEDLICINLNFHYECVTVWLHITGTPDECQRLTSSC